jgi:hypothetical protein
MVLASAGKPEPQAVQLETRLRGERERQDNLPLFICLSRSRRKKKKKKKKKKKAVLQLAPPPPHVCTINAWLSIPKGLLQRDLSTESDCASV